MSDETRHFLMTGKVQGVCYRAWMCDKAKELGITGWVRNLTDGRVEAIAQGRTEDLESLEKACHDGPSAANVEEVTSRPAREVWEDYEDFTQKPTAAP